MKFTKLSNNDLKARLDTQSQKVATSLVVSPSEIVFDNSDFTIITAAHGSCQYFSSLVLKDIYHVVVINYFDIVNIFKKSAIPQPNVLYKSISKILTDLPDVVQELISNGYKVAFVTPSISNHLIKLFYGKVSASITTYVYINSFDEASRLNGETHEFVETFNTFESSFSQPISAINPAISSVVYVKNIDTNSLDEYSKSRYSKLIGYNNG